MFEVTVTNNRASTKRGELLTEGQVGAKVHFSFNDHWTNMKKTAVFKRCGKTIVLADTEWDGETAPVPPEMTEKAGQLVHVGVYGVSEDGKQITPTLYAPLGVVAKGANPDGDPSTDPTLPVWAQIQGDLDRAIKVVKHYVDTYADPLYHGARKKTYTSGQWSWNLYLSGSGDFVQPGTDASDEIIKAYQQFILGVTSWTENYNSLIRCIDAAVVMHTAGYLTLPLTFRKDPYAYDDYVALELFDKNLRWSYYKGNNGYQYIYKNIDTGLYAGYYADLLLSQAPSSYGASTLDVRQFTLHSDPTEDMQPATKKYVDDLLGGQFFDIVVDTSGDAPVSLDTLADLKARYVTTPSTAKCRLIDSDRLSVITDMSYDSDANDPVFRKSFITMTGQDISPFVLSVVTLVPKEIDGHLSFMIHQYNINPEANA